MPSRQPADDYALCHLRPDTPHQVAASRESELATDNPMKQHGEHARHVKQQVTAAMSADAVGKMACNPNGQWGWLPDAPAVTEAFADILSRKEAAL